MNIEQLRTLILSDPECVVPTESLSLRLAVNIYLQLHMIDHNNKPEVTPCIINLVELIAVIQLGEPTDKVDLLPILLTAFPGLDFVNSPEKAAYSFNRYYRLELDIFGNLESNIVALKGFATQGFTPCQMRRAVKAFLEGYIHSVKRNAKALLGGTS